MANDSDVAAHYDAVADNYHRQYQRDSLYSAATYPANYFRLRILIQRISQERIRSVYEVGIGEGTPLVAISKAGVRVAGCDISQAMVEAARENFRKNALDPSLVSWADVQDAVTLAPEVRHGLFDAVIAAGVLPHVESDGVFLDNLRMLLSPGGRVFVEFRNKLFSLLTFNRHTHEFLLNDLLAPVSPEVRAAVAAELERRLAMDKPTPVLKQGDAPGYDAIRSRFHNPFELLDTFRRHGYVEPRLHWYHYHPAPPMLEGALGAAFRRDGVSLEQEGSGWRGYFLCSAGLVEARIP